MGKVHRVNWYFFVVLLLQLFLPTNLIFRAFNIKDIRLVLFLNHTIIFIVPAIIYLILTKQSVIDVLKLNKLHFKNLILIILLGFACQPIMSFFSLLSQCFFENEIGNFMVGIVKTPYIILLLLVAVLPAITEEITIRGIILSGYKNKNIYLASVMTGLLFGIMHLDPQQFMYATVLGFILAFVVRITNSIFSSAIIHFIINGTSITIQKIFSLFSTTTISMDKGTDISLKYIPLSDKLTILLFYGVIAFVFSVLVFFILKKLSKYNIEKGIISEDDIRFKPDVNRDNENVFNLPFILTIILYILIMVIQIMAI